MQREGLHGAARGNEGFLGQVGHLHEFVCSGLHGRLHPDQKLSTTSNLCCSENALLVLTATETGKRTPVGLFAM